MSIRGEVTRQLPVLRGLHIGRRTASRGSKRSRESVYERGHEAGGKKVPWLAELANSPSCKRPRGVKPDHRALC